MGGCAGEVFRGEAEVVTWCLDWDAVDSEVKLFRKIVFVG